MSFPLSSNQLLIIPLLQDVTSFAIHSANQGGNFWWMRYALAEWVTFILLILFLKQCLMIFFLSLCSDAHTHKLSSTFPSRCRWVYNVCIFLCTPLTVCSPLNPQQDFDLIEMWFCKDGLILPQENNNNYKNTKGSQKNKGSLCLLDITKRIKRGKRRSVFLFLNAPPSPTDWKGISRDRRSRNGK